MYSEIKNYCDDRKVTVVAISKMKSSIEVLEVYQQGQRIFGENKVQELLPKYEQLPKDIEWHLVGHLQTNKVKYIAPFVSLIHSVDSMNLLEEIDRQGLKNNRIINVLLQIHIANEENKFGLNYGEAEKILEDTGTSSLSNICIRGLMGMATLTENETQIRNEFSHLRKFFDKAKTTDRSNVKFQTLSMGMSSDYQIAIEEGSNMVRVGSAIFGERNSIR